MASKWLQKYQQASFRGVYFFVESHEFSGGRRAVIHEFPQRDRSRTEDLGRKIRKFSIEAYVLEDRTPFDSGSVISIDSDYFNQRDDLIESLESEGPGNLIHPYLGDIRVQVDSFSVTENQGTGRTAKFSITFVEAGALIFPQLSEANQGKVKSASDLVVSTSKNLFEKIFGVVGQASFVADQAAKDLQAQTEFFRAQVNKVTGPISELTLALDNLRDQRNALVQTPGALASQIEATFALLFDVISDTATISAIAGGFSAADQSVEPILGTTPSNLKSQSNQNELVNLFKRMAISTESVSVSQTDFSSVNAAIAGRNSVVDDIDSQLNIDGIDDQLFQDLQDLQSELVLSVPSTDVGSIQTVALDQTLPSLVVAHEFYLDLDREDEILEQNSIQNPSFVPGGTELEVVGG